MSSTGPSVCAVLALAVPCSEKTISRPAVMLVR